MINAQKIGLPVILVENLISIFNRYSSVEQVKLYGSRAKGTFRNGSDVDLTIIGNVNHNELLEIEGLIDDLLTPYTYDLSLFSEIENNDLLQHIERVGLPIYPA
ncbi:nucleotidyltransferase domain-containing protein [Teredinibacter waterburyi]|uniref:nucleotidyltransferase domain-containing protein n=1 Tax=Teredinibacter waterburyi TaxID=1500538 RepID=UPI00165F5660|nr:nucleotidyltransferase domain-containing protein [Teredinibacter waterburyi]